jgi:hypothetical protein
LCAAFFQDAGRAAESEAAPKRPNVLLIVADDASFGDLGFSGSVTRTPNLDRLADRGLMFTSFHVPPVCSVRRAMLLTGNNPVEIGLGAFDYKRDPPADGKPGYESYLTRNTATIAEILRDSGYFTAIWWANSASNDGVCWGAARAVIRLGLAQAPTADLGVEYSHRKLPIRLRIRWAERRQYARRSEIA